MRVFNALVILLLYYSYIMEEQNNFQEPEKQNENQPELQLSNISQVKKYFLYVMIGGLVLSATISIIAVLIGEFNDYIQKSLLTTFSIVIHSMLALAFVSVNTEHHNEADEIPLNTLFGIIVASFATSIFAIWDIMSGEIVGDCYLAYFYAIIAALLCRVLFQSNRTDKNTRALANSSMGVTVFLFVLLMPSVFVNYPALLPDIYYRLIAATAILLGTTSVLTAIMHRLYINKHPEINAEVSNKKHFPNIIVVIIVVVILLYLLPYSFSAINRGY